MKDFNQKLRLKDIENPETIKRSTDLNDNAISTSQRIVIERYD